MTGGESVFSFIKHPDAPEEAERHIAAPPPPPAPAPQAGPSPKQHEELCAKLTALEAKVTKLEEINSASAAAAAGLKAETQAAQLQCAGLEREVAGLKKLIEDSVLESRAGRDTVSTVIAQSSSLNSISLSVSLFEGRLKNIETGLVNELKERFSLLDSAFGETARKAGLAQEISAGSARRVEKMEERIARLPYLENRVNAGAEKLERIYELEALSQSLKLSVEGVEKHFGAAMRDWAVMSAEHKMICSDFESLSHNVRHLSVLFNQLRTELAFLMPKKQAGIGG